MNNDDYEMRDELKKKPDENEYEYEWRIGNLVKQGKYKWSELPEIMSREIGLEEEEYRGESAFRKPVQYATIFYDNVFSKMINTDYLDELEEQRKEIAKERVKLRTEKTEYNRWLREEARDEMVTQEITEAIGRLEPLKAPEYIKPRKNEKSYLLAFSDAHYGVEFTLRDISGNIINEYSPEIFEQRMWDMFNQVLEIIEQKDITELSIFDLGDGSDGIIRLSSQLMKLKYGVVEGSIRYADFVAQWLNALSAHVRIRFQMVNNSNHLQLRLCSAPKNSFTEEDMSRVMMVIIKERLKGNRNIEIIENPTVYNYDVLSGYNVVGAHGEFKNLEVINDLSRSLDMPISYLVMGHIHHYKSEEMGYQCEAIHIRSLIGIDNYSLTLNKGSSAGASLFTFTRDKGLTCEDRIILN